MNGFSAEALLRLPVRQRGIELGYPVDIVLDPHGRRALEFYRTHASTMRLLRGKAVRRAGNDVGQLEDVIVSHDGSVAELVVANGSGLERLRIDDALALF